MRTRKRANSLSRSSCGYSCVSVTQLSELLQFLADMFLNDCRVRNYRVNAAFAACPASHRNYTASTWLREKEATSPLLRSVVVSVHMVYCRTAARHRYLGDIA